MPGADYSTVRISFAGDEQRKPEYLAVNPKGRVPALVTDRGILTDTPAPGNRTQRPPSLAHL